MVLPSSNTPFFLSMKINLNIFPTAPLVDFVQVDFNSTVEWEGRTFCEDKDVFVMDTNGDSKYVKIYLSIFFKFKKLI